jgi:hypothetical protein
MIEVANHTDAPRVGREYDECDASDTLKLERMRSEFFVEF